MRHIATLALILGSSSLAFAERAYQDDGDGGDAYGGPSSVQPVYAPPPQAAQPMCDRPASAVDVMRHRWSVGLGVGAFSVNPAGNPDAATDFNITELSFRFRATYHLELELNLMGGRQTYGDGMEGDLALGGGTLGLRYRFAAAQKWNWWLMAGLGETTVARHDASRDELDAAAKPHGQFGIGVERRFQRFALQAEFRFTSIGTGEQQQYDAAPPTKEPQMTPGGQPLPPDYAPDSVGSSSGQQEAGQFTLGLNYYW